MDTTFMNSENSESSKKHVLKLKFTSILNLRLGEKLLLYQILIFIIHRKI